MPDALALCWAPTNVHGWGVFATHLLDELIRGGRTRPLVLPRIDMNLVDEARRARFAPLALAQQRFAARTDGLRGTLRLERVCVLHALGNQLQPSLVDVRYCGEPNVGFAFFERTDFADGIAAKSGWLDGIVAGSQWNADTLRTLGFPKVACVLQGIDTDAFAPGPATGRFGDRFVVFSGGKLELRKGQDLVLAAFRRFHARHPDALLVTVWMNLWPVLLADIAASPHVCGHPAAGAPAESVGAWVRAQGIPEGAHVDLGCVRHADMPAVLRECDAAVFPNRCEGGTNLVAMEAMATGLPCILSANSGHLDILDAERAYPLARQAPTGFGPPGSDAWRESDVDEIVAALDAIHADRAEAAARGGAAHAFMQGLSWRAQIPRLLAALDEIAG